MNEQEQAPAAAPAVFRRTLVLVVAALIIVVAVFAVLGYAQGPKLSDAKVDLDGVVTQNGQQLRLFANQAVTAVEAAQLRITPAVEASVSVDGEVIAVQFDHALRYDTDYRVDVTGVTSIYAPARSTLSYSFHTGSPSLYYLDRGEAVDQIVRTGIRDTARNVVYSKPRIQDYAVFDAALAVASTADDGTSVLSLVGLDGKAEETLPLPGAGTIDLLHANAATGYLGFRFTSAGPAPDREFSRTLFSIDLGGGSREVVPVPGLDGAPIQVLDWLFVPEATTLIAQTTERNLLLADLGASGGVTFLGRYSEFDSISRDGTVLVVGNGGARFALTFATGATKAIEPLPIAGEAPHAGAAAMLADGSRIQQIAVFNAATQRFGSTLVFDDGTRPRTILGAPDAPGSIESFAVSPNEQYVAVENVPNLATSEPDGYPVNGRSQNITTLFVEVSSGVVVRSVSGFAVSW